MEELIDRIENKIAELIHTNEQLREKIRLLSSERDQWVQECSLHEQERQNLNEKLEKLLSSLQEVGKELALAQHQHIEIMPPLKEVEEQLLSDMEMTAEIEEHSHCGHHHQAHGHGHNHHGQ